MRQYFADLLEAVDDERFEAEKFLAGGDEVVVLGRARMRIKSTHRTFVIPRVLRFDLRDG